MKNIKYEHLANLPQSIPLIAQWHQDEWQHISPDLTTQSRIQLYSSYDPAIDIPCCFIAIADNKPAGSASLVLSDMDTHTYLSPWLASVYVDKDFRQQGIASKLINHCLKKARQAGIKTLYLFTPDQTEFYQKRGWKLFETCQYNNENVDIMSFDLTAKELP